MRVTRCVWLGCVLPGDGKGLFVICLHPLSQGTWPPGAGLPEGEPAARPGLSWDLLGEQGEAENRNCFPPSPGPSRGHTGPAASPGEQQGLEGNSCPSVKICLFICPFIKPAPLPSSVQVLLDSSRVRPEKLECGSQKGVVVPPTPPCPVPRTEGSKPASWALQEPPRAQVSPRRAPPGSPGAGPLRRPPGPRPPAGEARGLGRGCGDVAMLGRPQVLLAPRHNTVTGNTVSVSFNLTPCPRLL